VVLIFQRSTIRYCAKSEVLTRHVYTEQRGGSVTECRERCGLSPAGASCGRSSWERGGRPEAGGRGGRRSVLSSRAAAGRELELSSLEETRYALLCCCLQLGLDRRDVVLEGGLHPLRVADNLALNADHVLDQLLLEADDVVDEKLLEGGEPARHLRRGTAEMWPRCGRESPKLRAEMWPKHSRPDVADVQPRRGRTVSPGDRRDAAESARCGRARNLGLDEHKVGLELLESALRSVARVVRRGKVGPAQANLASMGVRAHPRLGLGRLGRTPAFDERVQSLLLAVSYCTRDDPR